MRGRSKIAWELAVVAIAVGGLIASMTACATRDIERTYHRFSIEVGSNVSRVKNLRYLYGEIGWMNKPTAAPPGPIDSVAGVMLVPEEFEVSWESESGQSYAFMVPVRNNLPDSIKGKTIHFVIMSDRVEGYILTYADLKVSSRTRFY